MSYHLYAYNRVKSLLQKAELKSSNNFVISKMGNEFILRVFDTDTSFNDYYYSVIDNKIETIESFSTIKIDERREIESIFNTFKKLKVDGIFAYSTKDFNTTLIKINSHLYIHRMIMNDKSVNYNYILHILNNYPVYFPNDITFIYRKDYLKGYNYKSEILL